MPRMARFMRAMRQVVRLDSCPYTVIWSRRPSWASINFSDCTNMPPEPQHGSYTRPWYGSSISTSSRTMELGV